MRGYTSRMLTAGVSRHTLPALPEPTMAEFESQVYDLTYADASHRSKTTCAVLALDPDHADVLGRLRLDHQYGPGASTQVVLLERVVWAFESDRVVNILSYESAAEREHRRTTYAARRAA